MPDEIVRKKVATDYCRFMNAGDIDSVLALFSEEIRFEDPVGSDPIIGHQALRAHLVKAIKDHVHETAGDPVASMDNEHVVIPIMVSLHPPGVDPGKRVLIKLVSVIQVGPDGLIRDTRVFWGKTDVSLVSSE